MTKQVKKARPKKYDLRVEVRGMHYRLSPEEISQIEEIIEDEESIACTLEREPTNEVDPLAIKVVCLDPEEKRFTGRHIGYVARPSNEPLAKFLKKGARVTACLLDYIDPENGEGELALEITVPRDS